ncbi:MAG: sulfite exporter TauE/SafE family protein, partial [Cyclobacteriaceae bacterium]
VEFLTDYIWLFVAGLGGGFLAGLLGIGGGIIYILILPLALRNAGVPELEVAQYIVANSIFGTTAASLFGSITLIKHKDFYLKEVLLVGISGIITSYALLYFFVNTPLFSEKIFNAAVILFLLLILLTSFGKLQQKLLFSKPVSNEQRWYISTGCLSGAMSALSGLGGGTVVVPLLKSGLHMDIKRARSISLGVIFIVSGFITLFNLLEEPNFAYQGGNLGYIVFPVVLPMSLGVLLSSSFGVKVSRKISSQIISYIFAAFLLLVIIRKTLILFNAI